MKTPLLIAVLTRIFHKSSSVLRKVGAGAGMVGCGLALVSAMLFSGCGETVEAIVEPVPDVSASQVGKYKFEYFHKAPEDRPFVVVAVVTAKTSNLDKAKDTFRKHSKPFKAQAAVNLRAVKVGNYRGLSVHNWQADLVIWQ